MGSVPADRTIRGVIGLRPQHAAALADFAKAVSTPGTAEYRHYLPARRFEVAFSPTRATVDAVERTLRSEGLTASVVSSNRLLIDFRGTAAAVDSAFHTSLAAYRLPSGRQAFANTSAPTLPASIAPSVQAVVGLNDLVEPQITPFRPASKPRGTPAQRAAATKAAAKAATTSGGPAACKTAVRTAGALLGLTDTQLADMYGVRGLYQTGDTGQGQTVAVYELEPYRTTDIEHFDNCYFGAAATGQMLTRLRTVNVDGGDPPGPGSSESELDIDDVSALAPGANIDVYQAPPSDAGYLDDWNAIVADDTAKTVTSSWGSGCETAVAAAEPGLEQVENTIFEQAALQGQTILDAAGDAGSDGCAYDSYAPVAPDLSAADPASQPYVTAVGGTTVDEPSDPPVEQAWNDGAGNGAGGGGISAVWPQPAWQRYSTVLGMDTASVIAKAKAVSGSHFCDTSGVTTPCREVPDVSANADEYTGVTIDYDGSWGTIGGTSSSTPLWAAMLADIDSTPACHSAGGVGFANPSLYALASVRDEYRASFNDVTTADNDQFGAAEGLYQAAKGYDMATGLGTPRVTGPGASRGLAYYLCTPPATAPPTVTSVTPAVVSSAAGSGRGSAGAPVSLTLKGGPFVRNGAPDVAGVTIGSYQASPFEVLNSSTITLTLPRAVAEAATGTGGSAGVYDVTVTLVGGQTSRPTSGTRLTVTNDPSGTGASVPTVAAVTPSGGNVAGGTTMHIYGTGYTAGGPSTVTIGGVPATVEAATDTQLTVKVPPYVPSTTACEAGSSIAGDGVCQTEVQVHNASGNSATSTIVPQYSGSLAAAPSDGAGLVAAPTEWDYLPTPTVSTLTYLGPQSYASEEGFSWVNGAENEVTITGTGLGALGLEWLDVGAPGSAGTADNYFDTITPTSVTVYLPNIRLTHQQEVLNLAAQTLGSPNQGNLTSGEEPSNTIPVVYAPIPKLASVSTSTGKHLVPTAGGTRLTLHGSSFVDDPFIALISFSTGLATTEYDLVPSATSPQTTQSVTLTPQMTGLYGVTACTVSGCAGDQEFCQGGLCIVFTGGFGAKDLLTFYPPGRPSLTSIRPDHGPAGAVVLITGHNLAMPQHIYFGSHKLPDNDFGDPIADTGQPDPNQILLFVPRGLPLEHKFDVRVVTAESEAIQRHPKTPINKAVTFTVTPLPKHHRY